MCFVSRAKVLELSNKAVGAKLLIQNKTESNRLIR